MYSHDNYIKNHTSIRKAQKKYYDNNKAEICSRYAHIRRAWDNKHRAYLYEHNRLNAKIKKLQQTAYNKADMQLLESLYQNKKYLSDLHSRGLI